MNDWCRIQYNECQTEIRWQERLRIRRIHSEGTLIWNLKAQTLTVLPLITLTTIWAEKPIRDGKYRGASACLLFKPAIQSWKPLDITWNLGVNNADRLETVSSSKVGGHTKRKTKLRDMLALPKKWKLEI